MTQSKEVVAMSERNLHVVHLLIRSCQNGGVCFLVLPHEKWKNPSTGQPLWTLPTKKTVPDPVAPFMRGTSLEKFVDGLLQDGLKLSAGDYALEQEIEPAHVELMSPTQGELTHYTVYPVNVWVHPQRRPSLQETLQGEWLSCEQAINDPRLSPTAKAVFTLLREREAKLHEREREAELREREAKLREPDKERAIAKPSASSFLLNAVPERPSMDALATKWLSENRGGVRHLSKKSLDDILDAGNRAFNLRVADPYLRYQMQGVGFTWSFFTHKDPQDVHVHGAPVVEIYGVLEGELEIWWKPYYDRGTSAWCHQNLKAGDWLEVDSLQCHIVHWLGAGKGVVFKAGPGPLAEVGRLGVKGKTFLRSMCVPKAGTRGGIREEPPKMKY